MNYHLNIKMLSFPIMALSDIIVSAFKVVFFGYPRFRNRVGELTH